MKSVPQPDPFVRIAIALERIAAQLERDEVRAAARALVELTDPDPKRRVLRILRAVGEN